MQPDSKGDDPDLALSDAAIEWLVRLNSGRATAADHAEFARWRSQSSAHEAAAVEAEKLWYGVGVAGEEMRRATEHRVARAKLTRRTLLGCGAVILAGAALKVSGAVGPRVFADHATTVGEQRTIVLSDGSSAALNGNTALSVDFSLVQRNLTLHEGQATFTVAPGDSRPFIVEANGGSTRAQGTVFDIDMRPTETAVTVVEGKVSVTTGTSDAATVAADQRVRYAPRGRLSVVEAIDAAAETAWRRGKLIFNGRPLGDVIAEIERHRQGAIVIASPRLRSLAVTGVFETSDPEAILQAIEDTLPVRVAHLPLITILY